MFCQILRQVEKIHRLGFLYLDLKPDNIIISQDGACLIDFNACVPIGSDAPVLASPQTLPPESRRHLSLDERADQIGLGHLWKQMNGFSLISWIALCQDPSRRFVSLRAMEEAVMSRTGSSAGGRVFKGAVLLLPVLCCSAWTVLQSPGPYEKMPKTAAETAEKIEQKTLAEEVLLQPEMFLHTVRQTLKEQHLPMAGYLLRLAQRHSGQIYEWSSVMLSLFLQLPVDDDLLRNLLCSLSSSGTAAQLLADLIDQLNAHRVLMADVDLEQLVTDWLQAERLDERLSESLIGWLLLHQSQGGSLQRLPENLSSRLARQHPQMYALYQAAAGQEGGWLD